MRRGLMDWQPEEVPAEVLAVRVQQVAEHCRTQGLSAMVLYANFTRPVDVALLTHFVPFWSQALLAVTATGRTALVMATTGRTIQLIRATSVVEHVGVGSQIGQVLAQWLTEDAVVDSAASYGVVYPHDVPQTLLDQLACGLAPAKSVDVSAWWSAASSAWCSPAVVAQQARRMARAAMEAVASVPHDSGHSVVAAADGTCRSLGAEEVAVFVAPDLSHGEALRRLEGDARLGPRVAVQVSVAYKGHWVRETRTFAQHSGALTALAEDAEADAALERACAAGLRPDQAAAAVAQAVGADLQEWALEGPSRGMPLGTLASSSTAPGTWPSTLARQASLTVRLRHPAGPTLWGSVLPCVSPAATV